MHAIDDLLNSETGIEFEGKIYKLRQASAVECGQYAKCIQSEARAGIINDTALTEEERRLQLRDLNADIAAKRYRYGGEVCVLSLRTVEGIARMISIIGEDQGLTYDIALRFCELKFREIIAAIKVAEAEESGDPKELAALPALIASLGLPPTFLSSGLSDSAIPPSEAPPISTPSGDSASDN